MAVHKVSLNEFEEVEYAIIAMHTTVEDYRLAYFINKALNGITRDSNAIIKNIKISPKIELKTMNNFFL